MTAVFPSSWNPTEVAFDVRTPAAALLVLMDAWARGWRATVDGAEAPILRANRLGRAIVVPAGAHSVVFRHRPPLLVASVWISWAALAITVAGVLLARRSRPARQAA